MRGFAPLLCRLFMAWICTPANNGNGNGNGNGSDNKPSR